MTLFPKLLAALAFFYAALSFAAADANTASAPTTEDQSALASEGLIRPAVGAEEAALAVRLALERQRAASGEPPPVALVLPEHVARRDAPVRTHELRSYDRHPDQQAKHPHNPPESPDA